MGGPAELLVRPVGNDGLGTPAGPARGRTLSPQRGAGPRLCFRVRGVCDPRCWGDAVSPPLSRARLAHPWTVCEDREGVQQQGLGTPRPPEQTAASRAVRAPHGPGPVTTQKEQWPLQLAGGGLQVHRGFAALRSASGAAGCRARAPSSRSGRLVCWALPAVRGQGACW